MKKPKKTPLTGGVKLRYIEELRKFGLKTKAAEIVGVSPATVTAHRKKDKAFDELCAEAEAAFADDLMEEAVKRATVGETKPIVGGKNRDYILTTIQEKSDSILQMLVKNKHADFKEAAGAGGVGGGLILLPAKAFSDKEWQREQKATNDSSD